MCVFMVLKILNVDCRQFRIDFCFGLCICLSGHLWLRRLILCCELKIVYVDCGGLQLDLAVFDILFCVSYPFLYKIQFIDEIFGGDIFFMYCSHHLLLRHLLMIKFGYFTL